MRISMAAFVLLACASRAYAQAAVVIPAPIPVCTDGQPLVWMASVGKFGCGAVIGGGGGGATQPLTDALGIAAYALDPSRILKFDLSGLSTSTTRTVIWPDQNLTIPTSFLSLPFPDTSVILADATDATKRVRFELGGISTGTIRVITVPDMDLTLGSGGGGGATLSSNTFTGDQTIAKVTPQLIMQDTNPGLGSASVATIEQRDSLGNPVLRIGNTSAGYVVFTAPVGGISLDAAGNGGIFIDAAGVANILHTPVWGSGLGDFSAGSVYLGGTLGVLAAVTLNSPTTWLSVTTPITAASVGTGTGTTAIWDSSGVLLKQTSAARYKESIEAWTVPPETLRKFLALSPRLWDYIGGHDGAGGFIADDLATLGVLNRYGRSVLVNYDAAGQPESNRDYAIIGLQHLIIQDLAARVSALEDKVSK